MTTKNGLWTKKQVRQIVRLLKKNKDVRPIFSNINISEDGYIEFTDSYQLHRSKEPIMKDLAVGQVNVDQVEIWYKLAKARDVLTTEELAGMLSKDPQGVYPAVERLIPREVGRVERIGFHNENLKQFLDIMGSEFTRLNFTGEHQAVRSSNEVFEGILLPARMMGDDYR